MYPLDDDNLDHISREAAAHFEVEAGASGWDHLEQRLDKELPQEKKRRRFLFWLFLITATTGGALTAILTHQPVSPLTKNAASTVDKITAGNHTTPTTQANAISGNNNNETPVAPVTPAPPADKQPAGSRQQPVTAATDTKPGSLLSKPEVNQPATATTVTVPNKPVNQPVEKTGITRGSKAGRVRIQKAPATLNYATTSPEDKQVVRPSQRPLRAGAKKNRPALAKNEPAAAAVTAQSNNTSNEPDNRATNDDQATISKSVETTNEAATVQPTTAPQADSLKNKTAATPVADSTQTIAKQKKKDNKIKQPLEFGVMAGPDMSAVSFGPLYKAGYNFGVQVGYRFSNRWLVNAGVIYTKKFYKTDSSHFNYKEANSWPNTTLSRVEGNCAMWEIPVNVRYDLSYNDKRRWFVSTGLSTYLMDKENYDVYYRRYGGPAYPVPLNSDTNSTYLFSIWDLSVGMERSLGKRFSLQAEPYLKVPLQDLGKGNMRMNSYGILFTLKYKPFLNSKRSDIKK